MSALSVMDRCVSALRGQCCGEGELSGDLEEARAAVAELIEAANKPAVAYGCLSSTGVHFVSDDRDDCVEESRRDGSLVVEMIVRPTRALARIGGAS